ncbi:hypothetical protein ACFL6U_19665, partial [Planctomycetota bacterium]
MKKTTTFSCIVCCISIISSAMAQTSSRANASGQNASKDTVGEAKVAHAPSPRGVQILLPHKSFYNLELR